MIDAWIYDQEGKRQPFPMADTPFNRAFAEWLRIHDRYTAHRAGGRSTGRKDDESDTGRS